MGNTSATGGYLTPAATPFPLEDDALDAVFQKLILNITGLPGSMVRPRWQPIEPKQPDQLTDWCAFGIVDITPDDNAALNMSADGLTETYARHEILNVLVTFYGPNRTSFAQILRDGLAIAQNREVIKQNLINFINNAKMLTVPELVNQQWIRRVDLPLFFRRKIERAYSTLNLLSVQGMVTADNSSQGIITGNFNV